MKTAVITLTKPFMYHFDGPRTWPQGLQLEIDSESGWVIKPGGIELQHGLGPCKSLFIPKNIIKIQYR